MALKEESQNLTASIAPKGTDKWERPTMGQASAPRMFQNLIGIGVRWFSYEVALVFLDDIIVFGKTVEELLLRLEQLFARLEESGIKNKSSRCKFFHKKSLLRGNVLSEKIV